MVDSRLAVLSSLGSKYEYVFHVLKTIDGGQSTVNC